MANNEYSKGFILGTIIGGAVGGLTALLLAPKSGKELRKDIADKSNDYYNKASNYVTDVESEMGQKVQTTVNEGRIKAQSIIDSAKKQAGEILYSAESVLNDARERAGKSKTSLNESYDHVKSAAKSGVDAFKSELEGSEN